MKLSWQDLNTKEGWQKLQIWWQAKDPGGDLIAQAKLLDQELAKLFDLGKDLLILQEKLKSGAAVYQFKKQMVQTNQLVFSDQGKDFANSLDFLTKWSKGTAIAKADLTKLNVLQNPQRGIHLPLFPPEHDLGYAGEQAHYCLLCHKRGKDTCLAKNNPKPEEGCPLNQKISEMNLLLRQGFPLGALAIILIDNPLPILTGYRICNDCTKGCIFTKQLPVDVPSIESLLLDAVLSLPWGVEIYKLLSRWNPLKPWQKPTPNNQVVAIIGSGPAGLAMALLLLNEGFKVKVFEAAFIKESFLVPGSLYKFIPDKDYQSQGLGGVLDYGVTARWDKKRLLIARYILESDPDFTLIGNYRVGINEPLTEFKKNFSLTIWAGGRKTVKIPDFWIKHKKVFLANDFLYTINTQPELKFNIKEPVVIVGGGLTAIDVAQEVLRLWPQQPAIYFFYRGLPEQEPAKKQNYSEAADPRFMWHYEIIIQRIIPHQDYLLLETNQGFFKAGTLIIAVGNEKNPEFEADYVIGDADHVYAGSVVKAIASAKASLEEIKKREFPKDIGQKFFMVPKSSILTQVSNTQRTLVQIQSPLTKQYKFGQYFKIYDEKNYAFTPVWLANDIMYGLFYRSHAFNRQRDNLMGPLGQTLNLPTGKICLISFYPGALNWLAHTMDPENLVASWEIYEPLLERFYHPRTLLFTSIAEIKPNPETTFLIAGPESMLKQATELFKFNKILLLNYGTVKCTQGGLCGHCIFRDAKGNITFGCEKANFWLAEN